jgi:hypothetical protein
LVFLFLPHATAVGQETGGAHTLHLLGYEPGHLQLQEENLIPKVFDGIAHAFTYRFERVGETYRLFQFGFTYTNPKTDIEREFGGSEEYGKINGQFHLEYTHDPIHLSKGRADFYLGPRASYTYSLSYLHGWDSHAYWGSYLSLGPNGVARVDLGQGRVWHTTLGLSLAGLYSRPDLTRRYKTEDWSLGHILKITHERYSPGLWTNAFQIQGGTEVRLPVRHRTLAVGYASYFSRIERAGGKPLREMIHRIGMRIGL